MHRFLAIIASAFLLLSPVFSPLPASANGGVLPDCSAFSRNLAVGSTGPEVMALQKFLNAKDYLVATTGAGSPGQETSHFGAATRRALIRFQSAQNIVPAGGYFGPLTRARLMVECLSAKIEALQKKNTALAGTGAAVIPNPVLPPASGAEITLPAATTTAQDAVIPPQSIVGVLCTYRNGNQIQLMKGSGVMINSDGYILTARHLVDPAWTASSYGSTLTPDQLAMYQNSILDHCDVGLPENASLPSVQDIKLYNPSELITRNFQYRADINYLPSHNGLSDVEYQIADFAVLKISATNTDCPFFNANCSGFGQFAHALASPALPQNSEQIVSYGYPAEAGVNKDASGFYDFYLKGAVGTVGAYLTGNQMFAAQPLNFSFESSDIQNGRSGSPVFYKGRLIGILYGSTSTQESFNLSILAIQKILQNSGLGNLLSY